MKPSPAQPFMMAQLDELTGIDCPCGEARRAFCVPDNQTASVHLTDIHLDARAHYHKRTTEIYIVLEGVGEIELNGHRYPLKPFTAVMIRPGCTHRAIGQLRIINVAIPAFDPADEWID
ncbi:MAG: cupin domain-containing protein [Verrucomicrobia bacterium]|nr:cupin domain-containing protein [Verrucomicrobiota bacterium]